MDSTGLTTSLHGLRGMDLILNLRYPQPADLNRGLRGYRSICLISDPRHPQCYTAKSCLCVKILTKVQPLIDTNKRELNRLSFL